MWDFLSQSMAERAVVLTTHSMEVRYPKKYCCDTRFNPDN
jgi:hypothetical protein